MTDHRINLTLYKLEKVLAGEALDEVVDALDRRRPGEEAFRVRGRSGMTTTYGDALVGARTSLAKAGVESAGLDARLLLAAASGLDMAALIARGPDPLPAVARAAFDDHMTRRLRGEPVARILGEKEFWGLTLAVGPATLVRGRRPRRLSRSCSPKPGDASFKM